MKRVVTTVVTVVILGLVPVAFAATGLSGTYKHTITNKRLLGGRLVGHWALSFARGRYTVAVDDHSIIRGRYKITGSEIAVTDTGGPGKCPGTGRYSIKLRGTALTFKKISDPKCPSRTAVVTSGTWRKA